MRTTDHRANRLFIFLAGFFLTNALIGEFVGVKIFALEATLGAAPFNWSMFGISGTLNFTAGVHRVAVRVHHDGRHQRVLRRARRAPDLVGRRRAHRLCVPGGLRGHLAGARASSGWTSTRAWACPTSRRPTPILFGQGLWTICGSIVAFLVGQLIDVVIFHRILQDDRRDASCGCAPRRRPRCRSCSTASSCCTSPSSSGRSTGRYRSSSRSAR